MILHLTSGRSVSAGLSAPTMGLGIAVVAFSAQDMHQLLQMSDGELRERLSILYTRFAPFSQEHSDVKN